MDSDTVNAIADKLGIAADKVADKLPDLVSQWSSKGVATNVIASVAWAVVIAAVLAIAFKVYSYGRKLARKGDGDAFEYYLIAGLHVVLAALFLAFFVVAVNGAVSYATAPDAMFLKDMLVNLN